jgi:Transposase
MVRIGRSSAAGPTRSDGGPSFATDKGVGREEYSGCRRNKGRTGCTRTLRPNLDRLRVGVDLGDQWNNYCISGLGGETLAEGQFRTRQQGVAEFFQGLAPARVVFEVGTHPASTREIITGLGHEVLVANPRLMEASKRRRRRNDRIDAIKLARLGRVHRRS